MQLTQKYQEALNEIQIGETSQQNIIDCELCQSFLTQEQSSDCCDAINNFNGLAADSKDDKLAQEYFTPQPQSKPCNSILESANSFIK